MNKKKKRKKKKTSFGPCTRNICIVARYLFASLKRMFQMRDF